MTDAPFPRRAFLQGAALAAVPAALGADGPKRRPPTAEGWADRPMRWANLTFVETDPPTADLGWWLDLYRRAYFDAIVLSAGGAVAYYPTKVPFHHKSRWLGDRDLFGEMVDRCRAQGMAVTARVDPHAVHPDLAEAHPDWVAVDAAGQKRRHWLAKDYWVTCAYGPMSFEYMPRIIAEIVGEYQVDGLFANRWNGSGMCYCEHCARQFRDATGKNLPRLPKEPGSKVPAVDWRTDPADPVWRAYAGWRRDRLFAVWDHWDAVVREHNRHARFIPNMGGGIRSILDMKTFGERAVYLTADRQGRSPGHPPWTVGLAAKEFRAVLGSKPLGAGFSFGPFTGYRWIDSTHGPAEITAWTVDAVANGIRPSIGKTGATVEDTRWVPVVERLFGWHHANEKYLRNVRPLARVALVYSQTSEALAGDTYEASQLGMYQALIEARLPFEMVHDGRLDEESLAPFKLLVLPNITVLTEAQCDHLRAFVRRGGGLVATFETSLYDSDGRKRKEFGLADLFGARYGGRTVGPMTNSYMRLERGAEGLPALLSGFDGAERIVNTIRRADAAPAAPPRFRPLTLIPPFPSLPMEELYPRVPRTDTPLAFVREAGAGAGRVVYFPGDLDRTFWELLIEDHARLLSNAFHWAMNEPPPVAVAGPGMMDVTYWQQKDSVTVHLVNLGTAMAMRGYLREVVPLPPQEVRLRLPDGLRAKRVRLLVAGEAVAFKEVEGEVRLTVPRVEAHEVVAVDV